MTQQVRYILAAYSTGFWPWAGILVAIFGAMVVVLIRVERRRCRRLRNQHLASHTELPDQEFLQLAGVADERREVALRARSAIAKAMGVPPATVYPSDRLEYVQRFGFAGMDWIELLVGFEEALEVQIPDRFMEAYLPFRKHAEPSTVGRLIQGLAENYESFPRTRV